MGKISKAKLFEASLLNAGIPLRDTSKRGFKRATTAGLDKAAQLAFAQLFRDLGGREDLVSTLSALAMDEFSPATILVSHHVEEIPPGFTHALLLREGKAVAAGPIPEVLTAEQLSETFGMPLSLSQEGGRFAARAPELRLFP